MTEIVERQAGLILLADLESAGALGPTGLTLTDPDLPFVRWEALLVMAGAAKRTLSFVIGDLINFGEAAYGERYAHAVEATGLAPETLMNYASVCRRVPRGRRRPGLAFAIHAEVASLEPADQARWLAAAETNDWKRSELRDAIRADRAAEPPRSEPQWTPPERLAFPEPISVPGPGTYAVQEVVDGDRRILVATAVQIPDAPAPTADPAPAGEQIVRDVESGLIRAAAERLVESATETSREDDPDYVFVRRAPLDELAELLDAAKTGGTAPTTEGEA